MMANAVNDTERHRMKREAWDRSQRNDEGKIKRIWKGEEKGILGWNLGWGSNSRKEKERFWRRIVLEGNRKRIAEDN
jgi:hypothetical protein